MDDTTFDIYQWSNSLLGKKMKKIEEGLCCLICQDCFKNPTITQCGHTFCSKCILEHMDRSRNPNTSNQCPLCKENLHSHDLKPNRILSTIIQDYINTRSDLLNCIKKDNGEEEKLISNNKRHTNTNNNNNNNNTVYDKKITQLHTHGKSKVEMKKILTNLSSKIRTDGDLNTMQARYRDLVILNNSYCGVNNITFDEIVLLNNKNEAAKDKEEKKIISMKSKLNIENLRKGIITENSNDQFKLLAKKIRDNKIKINKEEEKDLIIDSNNDNNKEIIINNEDYEEHEEMSYQGYRIIYSNTLKRPFFYNIVTKIGQFDIPEGLIFPVPDSLPDNNNSLQNNNNNSNFNECSLSDQTSQEEIISIQQANNSPCCESFNLYSSNDEKIYFNTMNTINSDGNNDSKYFDLDLSNTGNSISSNNSSSKDKKSQKDNCLIDSQSPFNSLIDSQLIESPIISIPFKFDISQSKEYTSIDDNRDLKRKNSTLQDDLIEDNNNNNEWTCSICTLINEISTRTCSACGSKIPESCSQQSMLSKLRNGCIKKNNSSQKSSQNNIKKRKK